MPLRADAAAIFSPDTLTAPTRRKRRYSHSGHAAYKLCAPRPSPLTIPGEKLKRTGRTSACRIVDFEQSIRDPINPNSVNRLADSELIGVGV